MNHGTQYAYQGRRCRCAECTEGATRRRRSARRRKRGVPDPSEPICPWCHRLFNGQLGVSIHMARWCEERPAVAS